MHTQWTYNRPQSGTPPSDSPLEPSKGTDEVSLCAAIFWSRRSLHGVLCSHYRCTTYPLAPSDQSTLDEPWRALDHTATSHRREATLLHTRHNLGWMVVCRITEIDSAWRYGVAVTRFCHSVIAYVEWPGRRPRTDNTRFFRLTSPPRCLTRKANTLPWRHLMTPGRGRGFHSSGTRDQLHARRRRSMSLTNSLSNLRRQTAGIL
jgi:hypothetical protein